MIRVLVPAAALGAWLLALGGAPAQAGLPAAQAKSALAARIAYYESWTAERGGGVAAIPGFAIQNASGDETTLTFEAFGRQFQLLLQDNSELIRPLAKQHPGLMQTYRFYRGRLPDEPGSWVRLMQQGDRWRGMIWAGAEMYVIEPTAEVSALLENQPAADQSAEARSAHVIYRLSDTIADLGPNFCATNDGTLGAAAPKTALDAYRNLVARIKAAPPTAARQMDIALIEDFEFASVLGAGADTRALSYMQIVDGIFTSQVGVHIAVSSITAFDGSNEPFTSSDSTQLLCQVGSYKHTQVPLRSSGIAHLITGRTLNGTVVGIAYTGSICEAPGQDVQNCGGEVIDFASSLSEGLRDGAINGSSYPVSALIAAHEIGHNFGAAHDGDPTNVCASTPQTFLMAPTINGSSQFSQCSLNTIAAKLQTASCLQPYDGGVVNVAIQGIAAQRTLALDASTEIDLVVNSTGGATANAAQVAVNTSGGIALESLSAPGAECTLETGAGNCMLPSMAHGASITIAATVAATSLGSGQLTATASAPSDSDSTDDQVQTTVDIAAQAPAPPPAAAASTSGSGSSGGGALDGFSLLALAMAALLQRSAHERRAS